MRNIYEGLGILLKYDPDGEVCASHDEIHAGHNADPKNMKKEDKNQLKKLNWAWDEEVEAWHKLT